MPLLKFSNSVHRIKSCSKYKVDWYNFFELLIFKKNFFGQCLISIKFSENKLVYIFWEVLLVKISSEVLFFSSSYQFSKIFRYNATHSNLVSPWHVMTGTSKPIRKGIFISFSFFQTPLLYDENENEAEKRLCKHKWHTLTLVYFWNFWPVYK